AFTLIQGVQIYGGFVGTESTLSQRDSSRLHSENQTILDGSGINYHVVYNTAALNNTTVLDGFVITGGNASGTGANGYGGGIYNTSGAPVFRNLIIKNNYASNGGGMYNT